MGQWSYCKHVVPWARNLQEDINSTTCVGVVLAPEVQPGPHQVFLALLIRLVLLPFCHPHPLSQIPILQLGTLQQWG